MASVGLFKHSHTDDEMLLWSRAQQTPDICSREGGWVLNPYLGDVCLRDGAVESLRVAADISGSSVPPAGELSVGAWQSLKLASKSQVGYFFLSTLFLSAEIITL